MPYRFIDVPGMAHENAPASAFEEALTWILEKPVAAAQAVSPLPHPAVPPQPQSQAVDKSARFACKSCSSFRWM